MGNVLEGVRDWLGRGDPNQARALAQRGRVTYCVVEPAREPQRPTSGREARASGRRRTRMGSGKVLDAGNAFLCECLIYDRSATGLRLLLGRDVGLPAQFRVHDDDTGAIESVATVWRRGATLGARFSGYGPAPLKPSDRAALARRYYAIRD
jgi:hypothetical protein